MSQTPSSVGPEGWDLVADGYAEHITTVEHYAQDALDLAAPAADARVLDVAAGPGSLTRLAARRVAHVSALDYSPAMIGLLRADAAARGLDNVDAIVGDGQALPYPDAGFDAGFSMFGLFMFPDRGAGLRELHRVVRPGGRVVIASWATFDPDSPFLAVFAALRAALPELPLQAPQMPLSDPASLHAEMTAAGFRDVRVEQRSHEFHAASVDDLWAIHRRANIMCAMMQQRLGPTAWARVDPIALADLRSRLGDGEVRYPQVALLGLGER